VADEDREDFGGGGMNAKEEVRASGSGSPPDGVCQFALIALAVVFTGLAAITYTYSGMRVGVVILGSLCAVSIWAGVFASVRIRAFVTGLLTTNPFP
jgi:hypothetical protein